MPIVKVARDICEGYANCVFNADDVFDIDENDVVVVLRRDIPWSDRARVETAVQSCPVAALSLEDE